ncbi:glycosyltransferase [Neoroseomonas oryzicola]|uniref:Glycosyltransferase n=2 Tax=Neoroseomonas oryzicola TaxID=535904 RepID=A0A9X9WFL5_9PROT|nr:glycosyltransferase [Neoroseomonas oryzicola]
MPCSFANGTSVPRRPGSPRLPRTILLTNIMLSGRSGTEVVTEQLADGLRRRGHTVLVFTPQIGPLGEGMRARGHRVADRPGALPRPDIIHAHHTGPAMAALAAHPGVPGVFVSHDAAAPFDAAPPHPGIRRVLAVDERCRARLVDDGLAPAAVGLLPNAVDLSRIPPRPRPLPPRPARAVVLTKHDAHLPAIEAACAAAGIALDAYGSGPGRMTETPEALFAEADLVFATARSALEAAAAGAGVVVCDARGCAGFLTRAAAEAWLPWNLGAGILAQPADQAAIAAAIAAWSAPEAEAASALVRAERSLDTLLDRIEALHEEVLAEPVMPDPAAEAAATGAFIAGWVPSFDRNAPWRRLARAMGEGSAGGSLDALPGQLAGIAEAQAALAAALARGLAAQVADAECLRADLAALQAATALQAARTDALLRRGPIRRLRDAAAGLWRAAVPQAIRAPLWRWRTGRTEQPGRSGSGSGGRP